MTLAETASMDGDLDASLELEAQSERLWPQGTRDAEYAYSWTQFGVVH